MRLDKFFSSQSLASRKEVRTLIKAGRIMVNGQPALSPEQPVEPARDSIRLDGAEIAYQEHIYLMMNKPQGVVSATEDGHCRTVLDLVPPELWRKGLFPAGRLDKDTVGFVLLTDDGDFAHRILSPKRHFPKTYEAVISAPVDSADIAAFEAGLPLADGTVCRPAGLSVLKVGEQPLVRIVLHEGKYHQIKRMFEARGKRVLWLKRTMIGGLALDEALPAGGCRAILHKELLKILESQKG